LIILILFKNQIVNFSLRQDYHELKAKHNKNALFTDDEFPAHNSSVYHTDEFKNMLLRHNRLAANGDVIWKRAGQLVKKPKFALSEVGGRKCFKSGDLTQGYVGNCNIKGNFK
jgi:hypothetical protein